MGNESAQSASATYAEAVRQSGTVKVQVSNALEEAGLTSWKAQKNRARIDINPGARISTSSLPPHSTTLLALRRNEARLSLVFEMFNASSKERFRQLERKVIAGEYDADTREVLEDIRPLEEEFGRAPALFAIAVTAIEHENTKKTHQVDDELISANHERVGIAYNFPAPAADLSHHLVDNYCNGQLDNYCRQYTSILEAQSR